MSYSNISNNWPQKFSENFFKYATYSNILRIFVYKITTTKLTIMNTHFYTCPSIDTPSELVEGTDQWPANSGLYQLTMKDGSTREEWYTVALGWNDGRLPVHDIAESKFIKPFPRS